MFAKQFLEEQSAEIQMLKQLQLLKFGCNVVIFKSCLQAIDTLVTVSEILILKIKAVAALNLLSFSEKE